MGGQGQAEMVTMQVLGMQNRNMGNNQDPNNPQNIIVGGKAGNTIVPLAVGGTIGVA